MDDVIEKVNGAIKSDECQMVGTAGSPLGAMLVPEVSILYVYIGVGYQS